MEIHVNENFFLKTVCFQALGSLGTEHSLSNALLMNSPSSGVPAKPVEGSGGKVFEKHEILLFAKSC